MSSKNVNSELLELLNADKVLLVSLNGSYRSHHSIRETRHYTRGDWSISLENGKGTDLIIGMYKGKPVNMFAVSDALITDSTTKRHVNNGYRIRFDIEDAMTISPDVLNWFDDNKVALRAGHKFISKD